MIPRFQGTPQRIGNGIIDSERLGPSGTAGSVVVTEAHGARDWTRLLVESGFIVLSILLALLLAQWRDVHVDNELRAAALANIRGELEANVTAVEAVVSYHQRVLADLSQAAAAADDGTGRKGLAFLEEVFPQGLQMPELRSTAWETARITGAVALFDYELAYALSGTYQGQRSGVQTTIQDLRRLLFSREAMSTADRGTTLSLLQILVNELTAQELFLRSELLGILSRIPETS